MKKFFRKVWNFIKRNTYALAVSACVVLVLTIVSITAVTLLTNKPQVEPPMNEDITTGGGGGEAEEPSVPSGSDEVVVFTLPVVDGSVSKTYAEDHLLEDITSGFWQTHQGIDFKAAAGASVVSVFDGEVINVENSLMDGLVVTIKHSNNLTSVYRCLSTEQLVNIGDKVTKGQEIGKVSSNLTEKGDGTHLHFELYENDKLIDPTPYFAEGGK